MLQIADFPLPREVLRTSLGTVEVYRSCGDVEPELWEAGFGAQAKDGRFYQIVEDCMGDQFIFLYQIKS